MRMQSHYLGFVKKLMNSNIIPLSYLEKPFSFVTNTLFCDDKSAESQNIDSLDKITSKPLHLMKSWRFLEHFLLLYYLDIFAIYGLYESDRGIFISAVDEVITVGIKMKLLAKLFLAEKQKRITLN